MHPSRKLKLKIETIPKFKIQFPKRKSKIQFQICVLEIEIRIPKLFFKNLLTKFNLCGIIYMCLSGTILFVKEFH